MVKSFRSIRVQDLQKKKAHSYEHCPGCVRVVWRLMDHLVTFKQYRKRNKQGGRCSGTEHVYSTLLYSSDRFSHWHLPRTVKGQNWQVFCPCGENRILPSTLSTDLFPDCCCTASHPTNELQMLVLEKLVILWGRIYIYSWNIHPSVQTTFRMMLNSFC